MFEQRDCSSIGDSRDEQRAKKLPFDLVQQGWFYVAFRASLVTEAILGLSADARPWPQKEKLEVTSRRFENRSHYAIFVWMYINGMIQISIHMFST